MWGTGLIESAFKSRRFFAALSTCISSDFVEISVARLERANWDANSRFSSGRSEVGWLFFFFWSLCTCVTPIRRNWCGPSLSNNLSCAELTSPVFQSSFPHASFYWKPKIDRITQIMSHATIKMIDFPEGGQRGLLSWSIVCLVQFVEFFFFFLNWLWSPWRW